MLMSVLSISQSPMYDGRVIAPALSRNELMTEGFRHGSYRQET